MSLGKFFFFFLAVFFIQLRQDVNHLTVPIIPAVLTYDVWDDGLTAVTARVKTRRLERVMRARAIALALRMSHPDYHSRILSDGTLFCNDERHLTLPARGRTCDARANARDMPPTYDAISYRIPYGDQTGTEGIFYGYVS